MGSNIDININFGGSNQGFQSLIDNTTKLNQAIGSLEKSISDYSNATTQSNSRAAKSVTDYTGSYQKLSSELKNNRAALKEELSALEALRKTTGATNDEIDKQVSTVKELEKTVRQQSSALSQYNKLLGQTDGISKRANASAQALTKTFNSLGAVLGVSFGAYGAFRVLQSTIGTISQFNLAQKKLQSILGESNDGMREIEKSAIAVGRASIFGAKGVSELQIELAKMGFTKSEIESMQQAIVNLATATQEDLASSAEVVANIIRTFNLTASDSTMVVDIMGKAFNDSALDLSNFREAIKYVAPIAAQANFKFEETVALLEQLSNAGLKGSLAGTSLTNIISRLGDENSKFSKTLGRTVDGFDEFTQALFELKQRGADLSDTFELVDRRAAATFTILLNGTDSVEEFRKKLQEASGVMADQASVQMESLTYRTNLLKSAWEGLILTVDNGEGALSRAFGVPISLATNLLDILNKISGGGNQTKDRLTSQRDILNAWGIPEPESFKDAVNSAEDAWQYVLGKAADIAVSFQFGTPSNAVSESMRKQLDKGAAEADVLISKNAEKYADIWISASEKAAGGVKAFNETLYKVLPQLNLLLNQEEQGTAIYVQREAIIKKLTERYNEYNKTKNLKTNDNTDAEIKKQIQQELELLRLRKEDAAETIDMLRDGLDERIKILDSNYEYDLQIINKEVANEEAKSLKKSIITKKYLNAIKDEYAKYDADVTKFEKENAESYRKLLEDNQEALRKSLKEDTDIIADEMEQRAKNMSKNAEDALKLVKDNRVLSLLFPNMFKIELDDNGEGVDGLKDNIDALNEFVDIGVSQVDKLVDSWVDGLGRIVDARKEMVEEAEESLQTEIELAQLGFASNVDIKRKELEEAKKLRREAIADQQRAQKIQLAMDSASQISSLTTAAAEYFAATSQIPIVGVALAISAITTMFATIAKFKNLAKEQSAVKYEKGGWVNGNRHSQGGVHIEAEGGEFVINRNSALKHKTLIEAINKDKIGVDRMYLDGLKNGVITARVSLDDSQDLKAIRKALETKGKSVEYAGEYKIVKVGNVTTRIKINKYV